MTQVTPIREADFLLDQLAVNSAVRLSVPSVGVDVSEHHVRTAVVCKLGDKLRVRLATYKVEALQSALSCARRSLDEQQKETETEKVSVYYTGRVTSEIEQQLATTFEQAVCVQRQEKLTSHNLGVCFLITCGLPNEQLFHDISEFEAQKRFDLDTFKMFLPPMMKQMLENMDVDIRTYNTNHSAVTLSLIGSNNILTKLDRDGKYSVLDARSNGAYAMRCLWRAVKTPECKVSDFADFMQLAGRGNRGNVDSQTYEVVEAVGLYSTLPRDMPVFNFGKMERYNRAQMALEDLARSTLGMVTDMAFGKAMDLCVMSKAYQVYYAGNLVQHDFVRFEILRRYNLWLTPGVPLPKFFKTDATAALGACCQRKCD